MRRHLAIAVVLAVTLTLAGCAQVAGGGPITFEASPATVDGGALDSAGYELQDRDTFVVERTVDVPVAGERQVEITNHVATFASGGGNGEGGENASAGALVVLSTPQAEVAGQGTNPLGRAPLKEVVSRVASRAGDQTDVEHVGTDTITVLGTSTDVEQFASTTETESGTVETYVYVTRVAHGDDYVIAAGLVPEQFADDEESTIYDLMEAIEHDA